MTFPLCESYELNFPHTVTPDFFTVRLESNVIWSDSLVKK